MEYRSIAALTYRDYPLAYVTSLGVGGPADYLFRPQSVSHIQLGLRFAAERKLPITLIGYGTNLLVTDRGVRGFVIQIADSFAQAGVRGTRLHATAGCLFGSVSRLAAYHGLSGLEFAIGIPGGLGGAIYMNAGAYGGEIGPLVEEVTWVTADEIGVWQGCDYKFSYRTSRVQTENRLVAQATLRLIDASKEAIYAKMDDFQEQRRAKQPLDCQSAGSTFKRPLGHYVGPLIEKANLKGFRIGDAQVSTKHAGFVINRGNATAKDLLDLIAHIQMVISEKFGVELEPEVRIIGER